jgi:probable F420-dependent oxidoreductase
MKIGVQLPHFGALASGEGALRLAERCEELGFDSVWTGDHIVYPRAMEARFGREFYESIVTLAFVAARTRRITLGTGVLVLPYRNPLVVAKQLATIHALAGGRLVVGVGVGWVAEEFAALAAPFAERGAATDEALRVLRTLWTEEQAEFAGRTFRFSDLSFAPRPRTAPPLLVGGNGPRALRRAAELGDGWLPIWHPPTGRGFTPEALREKLIELRELRRRAGRSDGLTVAGLLAFAFADDAGVQPLSLVGAPGAIAEQLEAYAAAGLDHVILSPFYGVPAELAPTDLADVERRLARFTREVRRVL